MTLKTEAPPAGEPTETAQAPEGTPSQDDADPAALERMQERLTAIVTELLELDSDFSLLPDQRLDEFGLDSLMSIELAEVLGDKFGVVLSPTFAMNHPTVRLMAKLLVSEVSAGSKS